MLQTETQVKIGNKNYTFQYPNVGQTLDIESKKSLLSGGTYRELIKSGHKTAVELLNLIDGVAYFSTLSDEFVKDFDVINKFTTLEPLIQKQIATAFVIYWKWYLGVEEEINKLTEPEEQ